MSHPKIGKDGTIPRVALQRVSDWTLPVAGSSFSRPLALVRKPFAHEYPLLAGLTPAPGLLIADIGIDTLIFRHCLMRIEADVGIATPHRLRLGERKHFVGSCAVGRLYNRQSTDDQMTPVRGFSIGLRTGEKYD
jgi:hypothetical protein